VARTRLTATVRGRVQGVGFRAWVRRRAAALPLDGWARNAPDGSVEVVAEGERGDAEQLLTALRTAPGRPGAVGSVDAEWSDPTGVPRGFTTR
jgi:acylphosphatase